MKRPTAFGELTRADHKVFSKMTNMSQWYDNDMLMFFRIIARDRAVSAKMHASVCRTWRICTQTWNLSKLVENFDVLTTLPPASLVGPEWSL